MIRILKPCQREIDNFPLEIREDLTDAIARLEEGHTLSMPLSRPMPSIGKGVHELRLKDRSGIYRFIYVLSEKGVICLIHAFKKTTQQTSQRDIHLSKKRLQEVYK